MWDFIVGKGVVCVCECVFFSNSFGQTCTRKSTKETLVRAYCRLFLFFFLFMDLLHCPGSAVLATFFYWAIPVNVIFFFFYFPFPSVSLPAIYLFVLCTRLLKRNAPEKLKAFHWNSFFFFFWFNFLSAKGKSVVCRQRFASAIATGLKGIRVRY